MANFWSQLPCPFTVLAPLAGATDSAFRQICRSFQADVVVSEMASVAALQYRPAKTLSLLSFQETERPYLVQLFGSDPEQFAWAAQFVSQEVKPDGLDINFGCPVPKIIKQGAGAALGADLDRSRAVIEAVLNNTQLPVSIKLRAVNQGVTAQQFLTNLADLPIAAVAIHGRSRSAGFSGPADPLAIAQCRSLIKGCLIANGGIVDLASAQLMLEQSQADGLMIGRGALSRPWLFQEIAEQRTINLEWSAIVDLIIRQAQLVDSYKGRTGLVEFRKFLTYYVKGWPQARQLRQQLIQINNLEELIDILKPLANDNLID